MAIIIGGDLVPTKSNEDLFIKGDKEALLGKDLAHLLEKANYRIFNLETPLVNEYTPIVKAGPALMAKTSTINGVKSIGINLLTLANNHIMDQGIRGLKSTINELNESGISFVGVGENSEEACKPFFFEQEGKKIGIFACAEHEFSIATKSSPGAYGFDPIESFDMVQDIKNKCDYLIVLYHGGKEHYRYPSPNLQKLCRKMVKNGADLVICQHTHCIGCEEQYCGKTIVYGQGNFLFDDNNREEWQTGLLISIDNNFAISYIPIQKVDNMVRLASDEASKTILNSFKLRSQKIVEDGFIENNYVEFSKSMINGYMQVITGIGTSFFSKVLNKLSGHRLTPWRIGRRITKTRKATIRNFIECEAHSELIICGLREILEHKAD